MKKKYYLLTFLLFIYIFTSCKKNDNLSQDGDNKAKDYFSLAYSTDIGDVKVDFIGYDEFMQLRQQDNKFIVIASSINCEFCIDFMPKFFELANDYKIEHVYFLKFNEIEQKQKNEIAKSFTEPIIPTILFVKNSNIDEFQGKFDIGQMSQKIENYIKE